jgi:hypothetical protein
LVEQFEAAWPRVLKGVPLEEMAGTKLVISLYLSVASLRIYITLTVGPRGGIKEELVVIDPEPHVTADRLVTHVTDGGDAGRGVLVPLSELRAEVIRQSTNERREIAETLCRTTMAKLVERFQTQPPRVEQLRLRPSTSQSVGQVIYSGSPGLGKHGGGRHG